jgi:hypothetical protein
MEVNTGPSLNNRSRKQKTSLTTAGLGGQDLNMRPPKYKARRVFTTWSQHFVIIHKRGQTVRKIKKMQQLGVDFARSDVFVLPM